MGQVKNLVLEIREMDFAGATPEQIAAAVGLSVYQIINLLDADVPEDPWQYADAAADLDAEFYGSI